MILSSFLQEKNAGFVQGAIVRFICKCLGFFSGLLKWLLFSFQYFSGSCLFVSPLLLLVCSEKGFDLHIVVAATCHCPKEEGENIYPKDTFPWVPQDSLLSFVGSRIIFPPRSHFQERRRADGRILIMFLQNEGGL